MNRYLPVAIAVIAAGALPVLAQSGAAPAGGDTISALLGEVRALRLAMERAATTTPQIQLLTARLSVASERLARATRDADAARQNLENATQEAAALSARAGQMDDVLERETDPTRQRELRQELTMIRLQLEEHAGQENRLRARESELANLAAAEQAQWLDVNRRVDQLEQELANRRPRQ
jgi:chromosome segregation ATPase